MSSETPNPTPPLSPQEETNGDPLLDPGSFIDPTNNNKKKEPDFDITCVIAAKPITIVAPPKPNKEKRVDPVEMSKKPPWLPDTWKMEVKVRTSGSTAGLIDRYYYEPENGSRFRSKVEVMKFLETGRVSKGKKSMSKEDDAKSTTSASQKKNKRKKSKTDVEPPVSPISQNQKKSSAKRKKSDAA